MQAGYWPLAVERDRADVTFMPAAWQSTSERLDDAIAAGPAFAFGPYRARLHAIRAEPADSKVRIAEAERMVARDRTDREHSHVDVLSLAINNQPKKALKALGHADRWPCGAVRIGDSEAIEDMLLVGQTCSGETGGTCMLLGHRSHRRLSSGDTHSRDLLAA